MVSGKEWPLPMAAKFFQHVGQREEKNLLFQTNHSIKDNKPFGQFNLQNPSFDKEGFSFLRVFNVFFINKLCIENLLIPAGL
jgi:hypothetical protein